MTITLENPPSALDSYRVRRPIQPERNIMPGRRSTRFRGAGLLDPTRPERGSRSGVVVARPSPRAGAGLTSRELMAEVRERLAARGFDWGEAPSTERRPSHVELEVGP